MLRPTREEDPKRIAAVAEFAVLEPLERSQLVRVLSEYRMANAAVYLLVPPGRHLSTRVAVLRDFPTEELRRARGRERGDGPT